MGNPKLSIIIPTRSYEKTLDCVSSIKEHTTCSYEIIVISRDGGCAEKINEGISKALGDYIVLLHDDCIVTCGWSEDLSDVGAFRVVERDGALEVYGGFFTGGERYCHCYENISPEYSFFLCISKEALKTIGKFDEYYYNPWCLDVDMGLQIKKAGYTIKPLQGKIIHKQKYMASDVSNRCYLIGKWRLA